MIDKVPPHWVIKRCEEFATEKAWTPHKDQANVTAIATAIKGFAIGRLKPIALWLFHAELRTIRTPIDSNTKVAHVQDASSLVASRHPITPTAAGTPERTAIAMY
jgi:hypothetical protein